jgi:DNA-binding NarL/FixJ family response regulator
MDFNDRDRTADGSRAMDDEPASSRPIHLIILEPRALIRECLASSLRRLAGNIEILCGAGAAQDVRADQLVRADIIMLCTHTRPALNDDVQRQITWLLSNSPNVPIVLMAETEDCNEALLSGWRLRGYIPTCSTLEATEAALYRVMAGGNICAEKSLNARDASRLTPRERAVLSCLREGMPNKAIAHRLGISQSTVKAHIHAIMTKLQSRNRTEAAMVSSDPIGQLSDRRSQAR